MILAKPNALVYVRRDSLIVAGKHITPARLSFPADIVHNLEVLQPDKFIIGCQEFFDDHGLKGKRVLIVLDTAVVFSKLADLDIQAKPAVVAAAFVAAVPFEAGKRACLQRKVGTNLELHATNADLYLSLVAALHASNASRIVAITPAAAFEPSASKQLAAAIEIYMTSSDVYEHSNFADCKPV